MLGPIRVRDLRANISELGFEKGVVVTLERILDEHSEIRQSLRDCAQLLDKCIDETSKMVNVGGRLREELVELRRLQAQGDATDGILHD